MRRAAIVLRHIVAERRRRLRAHRLRRAENRAAERLIGEGAFLEKFENQVLGRVVGGADFLHDHVLLAREFVGIEGRRGENVGEDVERERHVVAEHARVSSPSPRSPSTR